MVTPVQLRMLKDIDRDGEPTDYADFADRGGSALGWVNRERVITALVKQGALDDDLKVTEHGRTILGASR